MADIGFCFKSWDGKPYHTRIVPIGHLGWYLGFHGLVWSDVIFLVMTERIPVLATKRMNTQCFRIDGCTTIDQQLPDFGQNQNMMYIYPSFLPIIR